MRFERTGWVAAALVLVLAGDGYALRAHRESGPGPESGRPALELLTNVAGTFLFGPLPSGMYVAYGLSTGAVHAPVRVVDVQPLEREGDVEFVGAKMGLFACDTCARHPGTFGLRGIILGGTCGPTDVVNRALYPAVGRDLVVGDAPHFVVVGRVTGPGFARLSGIVVTYRLGQKAYTVTSPVNGLEVRPDDPPGCAESEQHGMWFGGAEGDRHSELLD